MGSIFTNEKNVLENFLQFNELQDDDVVVTVGNTKIKSNNENITFKDFTNQQMMLQNCEYFVNHGGLNSVYESIYYGIPQLCYPMQQEQKMYSKIVQKKKVGIYMKKFDNKYFKKIKNKNNVERLSEMKKIIRKYDGTEEAYKLVKSYFFDENLK